jgi:hypothetical protein
MVAGACRSLRYARLRALPAQGQCELPRITS